MPNFWKGAIGLLGTAALATIILVLVAGSLRRFANKLMRSSKRPRRGELEHISGGDDALFDIIAVPGLGADPTFTWTKDESLDEHESAAPPPEKESRKIHLLKNLLAEDFREARILNFACNSNWLVDAPVKTTKEIGDCLLEQIKRTRPIQQRPIIFIGHSLGGIIIKQALRDADAQEITKNVAGFIFLGTPHQGSRQSILGALLTSITTGLGSDSTLLWSLGAHNKELRNLEKTFQSNIKPSKPHQRRIEVRSFHETKPTYHGWINVGLIVEDWSADVHADKSYAIDTDHTGLNKCGGKGDALYKTLWNAIQDLREPSLLEKVDQVLRTKCYNPEKLKIERLSGKLLDMDQCYINLAIIERGRQADHIDKRSSAISLFARQRVETPDKDIQVNLATLFDQRQGLSKAPRRILIRGRAGVGKTCLCKKIIYEFTHQRQSKLHLSWEPLFDRILWMPLRKLKYQSNDGWNLETLFYNLYFKDEENDKGRSLSKELHKAVMETKNNKTLFILDGFDEIAGSFNRTDDKRRVMLTLLNEPNVVITSRPTGALPDDINAIDLELETIGFYPEQVGEYLNQSFSNRKDVQDIQTFVEEHQLIQGLVRIPILLDALCYTWVDQRSTSRPSTMTEIYQDIELKLWKKDIVRLGKQHNGKNFTKPWLESAHKNAVESTCLKEIEFLEHLAFVGLYRDVIEFSTKDLDNVSKPEAGVFPVADLLPLSFLRVSDNTLEPDNQSYHFIHLTFQEYFAARYFTRQWRSSEPCNVPPTGDGSQPKLLSPMELLQKHKYAPRFDIFWRFVTGVLGGTDLVPRFVEAINEEPLDLLGPAHQRLVMHCLSEVSSSTYLPNWNDLNEELSQWLLYECSWTNRSMLAEEMECTEGVIVRALEEATVESSRRLLYGVQDRTMLTSKLLGQMVSLLDGPKKLQIQAEIILQWQEHLPDEIIAALTRLLENKKLPARWTAARVIRDHRGWSDTQLTALGSRLNYLGLDVLTDVLPFFVAHSRPSTHLLKEITSYLYHGTGELHFAAFRVLHYHKALPENVYETILGWLSHGNPDVRICGARALNLFTVRQLSRLPDEPRAFLVALLKDPDERVRGSAAEILKWQDLQFDDVFLAVWPLLRGNNYPASWYARSILKTAPVSALLALLNRRDERIKAAAIDLIRQFAHLPISMNGDDYAHSQASAVEVLGPDIVAPDELLKSFKRLLYDDNELIRVAAVQVLTWGVCKYYHESDVDNTQLAMMDNLLPAVVQNSSGLVRKAGVQLLLEQCHLSSKTIAALISVIDSKDSLKFLLSLIDRPCLSLGGLEFVVSSMHHEDPDVRRVAINILGRQPTPETALESVTVLLRDKNPDVRIAAINFINEQPTTSEPALEELMLLLQDEIQSVRIGAVKALCKQPTIPETTLEPVAVLLRDESPDVRIAAINFIIEQPTTSEPALEALMLLLQDEIQSVRIAVMKALCKQPTIPEKALKAVISRLEGQDPYEQRAAIMAVWQQPNLPSTVLEAVVLKLDDENSDEGSDENSDEGSDENSDEGSASWKKSYYPINDRQWDEDRPTRQLATDCLLEQRTLPCTVLKAVATRISSKDKYVRHGAEAILLKHDGPYLDLLKSPYFKSFFRFLLKKSFKEPMSYYIDGDSLCINLPDGIRKVSIVNQQDDLRRRIYTNLPKTYPLISAKRWRPKDIW